MKTQGHWKKEEIGQIYCTLGFEEITGQSRPEIIMCECDSTEFYESTGLAQRKYLWRRDTCVVV